MKIAILDHENNRTIVAEVPEYLTEQNYSSDNIAEAILTAIGLSFENSEWMIGEFDIQIDVNSLNSGHGYNHNVNQGIEQLTQDFKIDALAALNDSNN